MIGPYLFLGKFVWTNGPESSSKASPYTGIGPWMALPSFSTFVGRYKNTAIAEKRGKPGILKNDKDKASKVLRISVCNQVSNRNSY